MQICYENPKKVYYKYYKEPNFDPNFCKKKKENFPLNYLNYSFLYLIRKKKEKTLSPIGRNVRFEKASSFPEEARAQRARVASLILAGESVSRGISKPDNYSSGFFERSAAGLVGLRPALGPNEATAARTRARARVYTLAMQQP